MAEKYDITSKILALIQEQCEEQVPAVSLENQTTFEELGFDWLAHAELVMRLEEEFSLVIGDEEAEAFLSVQSVIVYISKRLTV